MCVSMLNSYNLQTLIVLKSFLNIFGKERKYFQVSKALWIFKNLIYIASKL